MPCYRFEGKTPRIAQGSFVHPEAVLIGDVVIEEGCYIGVGASLRGDGAQIYVGPRSNVQDNAVLHGSVVLGPESHIGHGAILHGCTLEHHVYVGMGAVIMDRVVIGDGCVLGSCTLVTQNVEIPAGKLVMGVPGQIVGDVPLPLAQWTVRATSTYQKLPARYLAGFERVELAECLRQR